MTEVKIQTLHPLAGKTNKCISATKYMFIKDALLSILNHSELTHTELMEKLYARVKDDFEGGVQWYGETVKLDLEARQLIERTGVRPEKYRLVKLIRPKKAPKKNNESMADTGSLQLKDGDHCEVVGGTHKGKVGTVKDIHSSKTGQVTITVVQKDGSRFKTLARNVVVR